MEIKITLTTKFGTTEEQIIEASKKTKNKTEDKKQEEAFNLLMQEKITEEKTKQQLSKKKINHDDSAPINLVLVNPYIKIQTNDNLSEIRKKLNKKKCLKCGDIFESDDVKKYSNNSENYICNSCLNKEIALFINENYF